MSKEPCPFCGGQLLEIRHPYYYICPTCSCPKCGAKAENIDQASHSNGGYWTVKYYCGSRLTSIKGIGIEISDVCQNRQIAQLTEKLETWRGLKENLDHIVPEEGGQTEVFIDNGPLLKLRGLGEVE